MCLFISLSLSSSEISAKDKIFLCKTADPFSQPDLLLQSNAIQTEKTGTKWFLTRTARGCRVTYQHEKEMSEICKKSKIKTTPWTKDSKKKNKEKEEKEM